MQLLDVQPYETALQRLLRAGVCSDDQLHDYHLAQALRGVAYAVNRRSLPVAALFPSGGDAQSTTRTTRVTATNNNNNNNSDNDSSCTSGSVVVLCRMCMSLLDSRRSLRTVVYTSTRLLCDDASSFGEGNERPCCTAAWVEALCSSSVRTSYLHKQMNVHRRLTLGYLILLSRTVHTVSHGYVKDKRLCSHFAEFTQRLLEDVVPYIAIMADTKDTVMLQEPSAITDTTEGLAMMDKNTFQAPSRLTVEANNTLLHLFHDIALDVLVVHQNVGNQTAANCPVVLDHDVPFCIWPVISILQGALLRALHWIQHETTWYMSSKADSLDSQKEIHAMNEAIAVVKSSLENVFTCLIQREETLECSRRATEQEFGQKSKDYHTASSMMWTNTLKLFFLSRSLTNAWMYVHTGVGDMELHHKDKDVLALIGSFVSSVPSLEEKETEGDVFLATTMLLSAALASIALAPVPFLQAKFWSTEIHITQEIHNVIIQRGLRFKDDNVQKLSALLSRLILYGASKGSAFRIMPDTSKQLLELLSDGRDGTSHCVTGVLIRAAVEQPHTILPSLFRLLQHGDVNTRRNALDVLAALPEATEDSVYGKFATQEQMRPVLRILSEELLLRIQDDELQIRLQSSKLFSKVWPEDICRPLLKFATQRDRSVKRQSAAQQALRSVVEAHMKDGKILLLIIQESLVLLGENVTSISPTPSTPADILAFSTLRSSAVDENNDESSCENRNNSAVEGQNKETQLSMGEEGNFNERLMRLVVMLGKHWAEGVVNWTEECLLPLLERAMEACTSLEQELVIRVMTRVVSICGLTTNGLVVLSLCSLQIMKRKEKDSLQTYLWLERNNSSETPRDSGISSYQVIAPLLFLRECPRFVLASFNTVKDMPSSVQEMWELLWSILLSSRYRKQLPVEVQRLVLELVCKYSTAIVIEQLSDLESKYITNRVALDGEDDDSGNRWFLCRVGFFCIGSLLSQNKSLFHPTTEKSDSTASVRKQETDTEGEENEGGCETKIISALTKGEEDFEFSKFLCGAQMVRIWTGKLVMPWLLSEEEMEGDENNNIPVADCRKLSRSAVECLALILLIALNHHTFESVVSPFVMLPLNELATECRVRVNCLKEDHKMREKTTEWNLSSKLLGWFEFSIHIHQCALGILRADTSAAKSMICLYLEKYMPCFIEIANASCTASIRLNRSDIAQVAVEACHVLFLAVMASSAASTKSSKVRSVVEENDTSRSTLVSLDSTDRNALITFAVGTARYSNLPKVQSEGVKLLSALLGAAPDIFMNDSDVNEGALAGALSVLGSVALMHPDAQTRILAEQVLKALQAN